MLLGGALAAVSNDRHLPVSEQGENSNTVKGSCKDCKIRSAVTILHQGKLSPMQPASPRHRHSQVVSGRV